MANILDCFKNKKPVIGVIHTKGTDDADMLERAKREIDIYEKHGVDGVLVETYFGDYYQVEKELEYLKAAKLDMPYGVNCLNVDAMGFELANKYDCRYIQIDSVVGHVKPRDEASLQAFFDVFRTRTDAYVMGGVRFKYQPVLSANTLRDDLETAKHRCDAVCVTGDATGEETSLSKIKEFREELGGFPLIVCAGVTPENIGEQLKYADAAVIASYFKDNYKDTGELCEAHVDEIMNAVKQYRNNM